ncbi:MAG: L-threonylcarbamoyladenylate synthase [Actinomycetota bacterium]
MSATDHEIDEAVTALRRGEVIGLPTETVYGLAADASSDEAVGRIYRIKGRPADHPLIVHLAQGASLEPWVAEVPATAARLGARLWPGPLTVVLRAGPHVSSVATGRRPTVAVRVPDHPVAAAVLERFQGGLAAPSANRFGRVSPTTAADVRSELGDDVPIVLDGGPSDVGLESTIVSLVAEPTLLRPGGVPAEVIEEVLGAPLAAAAPTDRSAPGTLPSHYSPSADVVLVAPDQVVDRARVEAQAGRRAAVLVGPDVRVPRGVLALRTHDDPADQARVLYRRLRDADDLGAEVLITSLPEEVGLGRAVADRLRRAAH